MHIAQGCILETPQDQVNDDNAILTEVHLAACNLDIAKQDIKQTCTVISAIEDHYCRDENFTHTTNDSQMQMLDDNSMLLTLCLQ